MILSYPHSVDGLININKLDIEYKKHANANDAWWFQLMSIWNYRASGMKLTAGRLRGQTNRASRDGRNTEKSRQYLEQWMSLQDIFLIGFCAVQMTSKITLHVSHIVPPLQGIRTRPPTENNNTMTANSYGEWTQLLLCPVCPFLLGDCITSNANMPMWYYSSMRLYFWHEIMKL